VRDFAKQHLDNDDAIAQIFAQITPGKGGA
jgi:hypothetical protein